MACLETWVLSCNEIWNLLGLFCVPTVIPEEMKFAKYPIASGEDLHLKFQTRA